MKEIINDLNELVKENVWQFVEEENCICFKTSYGYAWEHYILFKDGELNFDDLFLPIELVDKIVKFFMNRRDKNK